MTEKIYDVLFVCNDNAARSILAEGLLRELGRGRFKAHSAGSRPRAAIDPYALQALEHHGLPTQGLHSKSWRDFTGERASALDFVITLCDEAAGEACPVWPGQPVTAQWSVPDPGRFDGEVDEKLKFYVDTALIIRRRIELLLALSLDKLDALSLHREVSDIGAR